MNSKRWLALAAGAALITSATAFDAGPHNDISADSLGFEGFGSIAVQVAQVSNWFNDLYEQDTENSYSGHVSWFGSFSGFAGNLLTLWRKEDWPKSITDAAERMHFDSSNPIDSTPQAAAEWDRLARATRAALLECARTGDVRGGLCVLGMTLHQVQDFYTHTNWVEPVGNRAAQGFSGPGWAQQGKYGSHPTWFDVPEAARNAADVYSRKLTGQKVGHGSWDSKRTGAGELSMAKDWSGRQLYDEAYVSAAIASRQWIRAARSWVNNPTFWSNMQRYSDTVGGQLAHDQSGMFSLSWTTGHWNGNTGAHGMKIQIIDAGITYFEGHSPNKTVFRKKWESLITRIADPNPPAGTISVGSSADIARNTQFIKLQVNYIQQHGDIDGGDVPYVSENDADWYVKASIAGQPYKSSLIDGHNKFTFPAPYAPMTFMKMVTKNAQFPIPFWTMRVTLHTGNVSGAGSDMDLFLRINDQVRLEFPYGNFDDFERNRTDTYTFAIPAGMDLNDIGYLQLEKRGGGDWNFGGMKVEVNGWTIYNNMSVNQWMRQSNQVWRAPALLPFVRTSPSAPIILQLWDDDYGLTGGDDQADIGPLKGQKDVRLTMTPGTNRFNLDSFAQGDFQIRGQGDSDTASIGVSGRTISLVPGPGGRFDIIRGTIKDSVLTPIGGGAKPPVRPVTRPPIKPTKPPIKPTKPPIGG